MKFSYSKTSRVQSKLTKSPQSLIKSNWNEPFRITEITNLMKMKTFYFRLCYQTADNLWSYDVWASRNPSSEKERERPESWFCQVNYNFSANPPLSVNVPKLIATDADRAITYSRGFMLRMPYAFAETGSAGMILWTVLGWQCGIP